MKDKPYTEWTSAIGIWSKNSSRPQIRYTALSLYLRPSPQQLWTSWSNMVAHHETHLFATWTKGFHSTNPTVAEEMTILDVLSHSMGLQRWNQLWTGSSNVLLLNKSQIIPHIEYLKLVKPFRKKLQYSSWGYTLAGELIDQLSGQKWSEFLDTRVFKPLNISRSCIKLGLQSGICQAHACCRQKYFGAAHLSLKQPSWIRNGSVSPPGVVVLTNSISPNDAAHWIAQLVLENFLDVLPNDYKLYATQSAKAHVNIFPTLRKDYEGKRSHDKFPKPLVSYVGRCFNSIRNFHIDIDIFVASE